MLPKSYTSWLTINRSCNLRCAWCYAKTMGFSDSENMSMDTANQAVNILRELPLRNVIIIGGEPTIHPNFLGFVRLVKQANLNPLLVTNSIRFEDRDFLASTIKAGIGGVTTSLKAASEEDYAKFTGKRAFKKVMTAIRNIEELCRPAGIYHKVSITVCKNMLADFGDILDIIAASGVQVFSFDMERPIIVKGKVKGFGMSTPQEMANFFVGIYPKIDSLKLRFVLRSSIPLCLFPSDFISELTSKNQLISGCQLLDGSGIIIDPRGRILPCNHFCDNPLGQIGVDFSTAEEFLSFRRQSKIVAFYDKIGGCPSKKCSDCAQWKYCGGGCRTYWFEEGAKELIPELKGGE